MNILDYEMLSSNPDLIRVLTERARRERAEAVHRLLIAPFARLFGQRHAARTHLRHSRKTCSAAA
jgi:hypothetical protein